MSKDETLPHRDGRGKGWSLFNAFAIALLSLCAAASLLWQAISMNLPWFTQGNIIHNAKLAAISDVDQDVFLNHVAQHPTFLSTLSWWHTPWLEQAYPWYWRPLTMLAFWTEDHLFGAYRFDRWQAAEIVFHVLFGALLALFAYRITGSRIAPALTILAFSSFEPLSGEQTLIGTIFGFSGAFTTPDANVVLMNWKDQVEVWGGACTLGALIFCMSGRWWAALACACIGICFKESGWLVFPMVLGIVLYTGKLKAIPLQVWVGTAIAIIILLALRASGGPHLFSQMHHDKHVHIQRYLLAVTDQNVHGLVTNQWIVPVFGFALAWLVLTKRIKWIPKLITGSILLFVSGAVLGWANDTTPNVGIALLIDPSSALISVFYCFIEGTALLLAWREPQFRRQAVLLYALVLLSALSVLSILQGNNHMLYLTNAFQSTLVAVVAVTAGRQLKLALGNRGRSSELPAAA